MLHPKLYCSNHATKKKMFISSYIYFIFCLFTLFMRRFGLWQSKRSRLFKTLMNWFYSSCGFGCCCSDYWTLQRAAWCVQGRGLGGEGKRHPAPSFHEFLQTEIVHILSRQYRDNPVSKEFSASGFLLFSRLFQSQKKMDLQLWN